MKGPSWPALVGDGHASLHSKSLWLLLGERPVVVPPTMVYAPVSVAMLVVTPAAALATVAAVEATVACVMCRHIQYLHR